MTKEQLDMTQTDSDISPQHFLDRLYHRFVHQIHSIIGVASVSAAERQQAGRISFIQLIFCHTVAFAAKPGKPFLF